MNRQASSSHNQSSFVLVSLFDKSEVKANRETVPLSINDMFGE